MLQEICGFSLNKDGASPKITVCNNESSSRQHKRKHGYISEQNSTTLK